MQPSLTDLFRGFLEVALSGFGGVLAFAHRTIVERRGWLSEREFTELLGLSQVLPGGNIINMAIFIGARFHGLTGVLVALAGLMLAPLCLLLAINSVATGSNVMAITAPALRGAAPVVAGLTLAAGLKMVRGQHWTPTGLAIGLAALTAVGLLQFPLVPVLLVLAPLSIGLSWRRASSS